MAQVHALLLTSDEALSTDEIMETLGISRGGVNTNVRELIVWNLVYKSAKPGDRKEFFVAEKDIWEVAKRITRERQRREIEPLMHHLNRLKNVDEADPQSLNFVKTVGDIERLVGRMSSASDTLMKLEENTFFGTLIRKWK